MHSSEKECTVKVLQNNSEKNAPKRQKDLTQIYIKEADQLCNCLATVNGVPYGHQLTYRERRMAFTLA